MISIHSAWQSLQLSVSNWFPEPETGRIYDRTLVLLALMMMAIGLIAVTSASMPVAERMHNNAFHFAARHAVYLCLALLVGTITLHLPISFWHKYSGYLLGLGILLLILVLLVGRSVNGSTRWLMLGPITIQAAEPAKLFFFTYLASYLVRRHSQVQEDFSGFAKPLAVLFVLAILLLNQPDLGTVIVMAASTIALLFLAGAKLWQFIALLITMLGAIIMLIFFEPYRMSRVTSFWDPWQDPFGKGYQLTQSLMAYGRGGLTGEGLGNSVQKLAYLPEAHTDFVFAVLAEEIGFIGVCAVLLIIFTLVIKALLLGKRAMEKERFYDGFLAYAIAIWFSFQTAVNVGASAGLLPTKGLTLPLISYGGSSLIVMTIGFTMLIRIDHELKMQGLQAVKGGVR